MITNWAAGSHNIHHIHHTGSHSEIKGWLKYIFTWKRELTCISVPSPPKHITKSTISSFLPLLSGKKVSRKIKSETIVQFQNNSFSLTNHVQRNECYWSPKTSTGEEFRPTISVYLIRINFRAYLFSRTLNRQNNAYSKLSKSLFRAD